MSADYFGFGKEDDGTYRAWRSCQQGSVSTFKLVPTDSGDEPDGRFRICNQLPRAMTAKAGSFACSVKAPV